MGQMQEQFHPVPPVPIIVDIVNHAKIPTNIQVLVDGVLEIRVIVGCLQLEHIIFLGPLVHFPTSCAYW
jgi:hypothetical protein